MTNAGSQQPTSADHCSPPMLNIAAQLCCTIHASGNGVVHKGVAVHTFGGLVKQSVLAYSST